MIKENLFKELQKTTKLKKEEIENLLETPVKEEFGDLSFPCFKISKEPIKKAAELKEKIDFKKLEFLERVEAKGPYLNFFLNKRKLAELVLLKIFKEKEKYGSRNLGKGKRIVIDFSSPNIAKPFTIAHLRSTVIGNSLYQISRFLGYQVIGVNHLGDWGTQFGKLIVAYKLWGKEKELEKEPIKYLLSLYVKFHQEEEKDPGLGDQAREWFKKLEEGNKEALALWQDFRELSLEEFQRLYRILNTHFDSFHGEAFYQDKMEAVIDLLKKKKLIRESRGALVVDLEKFKLPPLILKKSDEASTYATRDLAAALYRIKEYQPVKIIYVVSLEQNLHFQQLFKTLELIGYKKDLFVHINFGVMSFGEKKISTRKGQVIFLEEVLNESIERVKKIIEEKNPFLKNKEEVAKIVGVGAIIFWDLKHDWINNLVFDWERVLNFEGESGPYLQYTHARACSILRKSGLGTSQEVSFELLKGKEEIRLIKILNDFPEAVIRASETYKPHLISHYLLNLAQAFNEFYHFCPVISETKNLEKARLLLVDSVRQVLENGLKLLGIKAPKEM